MLKFTKQQVITVRRSITAKLQEHWLEIIPIFPLHDCKGIVENTKSFGEINETQAKTVENT